VKSTTPKKVIPSPADQIINEKLEKMTKITSQSNKDTTLGPTSSSPLEENHVELNSSSKITNKNEVVTNSNNNCDNKDFDDSDTDWEIIDEWNDNSEAKEEILEKSCNPMMNSRVVNHKSEINARKGRLEAECPPGRKALGSKVNQSDKELSSAVSVIAQKDNLNSTISLNDESMGSDGVSGVSAFNKTNSSIQEVNLVDPHHEIVDKVEEVTNDTGKQLLPSSPAMSSYSNLRKPQIPFKTSLKFERQDSNFLPSGLYGLLFLDVEVLLDGDGDSDSLQVTQLGCQTYFSNGELWSSFFTAVVPKEMDNYMNHINPKLCPTLMSLLRLTFSHFNYQLVRPDGSSVECDTHDQAILRFDKYVKKVSELVDGIVFVVTRPELVLPFLKSLELNSDNTVVGMVNLTEVFSDSFPHSSSPDDVAAIYKLVYNEESLPSEMDCDSKSKILVKIIEKLLPKVDYEKFVQPYGKLLSLDSSHVNRLVKISACELGLCESFSPQVEAISKISVQNQMQPSGKFLNHVLVKEKSEVLLGLHEDFALSASTPNSSVKQEVVKIEANKVEVDLDSSVEYLEPEHDWDKFNKMEKISISGFITPDLVGSRELIQKADFVPGKLITPEPQGNVDIDTEDEHDTNSLSGASDSFVPQLRLSKELVGSYINAIDEDVIIPTGPVCVCDKFESPETIQQISGDLAGLCKECRSCQVKMVRHLVSYSKVKTIVARIEDVDGVVSEKCVKFIPSPFLVQQKKAAPYRQIRKVFLNNYILLCIEENPNINLDSEENSLIGLCQVWLGTKVEDLEYHDDVSLICEDIKIMDDGSLVLLCSTELVLRRPLPLMVSNISQYLHIKPESRIVTASKTGMVSVTCKSGTTGYLPSLGDNVGTATTDVDEDLVDQIVKIASICSQPSLPVKRKATSEIDKPQSKKFKKTSPLAKDSALATLQSIKAKHALVTKAPLKFGIKKAFKASPLIRAEAFTDQANKSSDEDSGSPSPPPLAPVQHTQGSEPPSKLKLKQHEVIDLVGISGLARNTNLKTSRGKSLPGRKMPPSAFPPYPPEQLIPTVINRQAAKTFNHGQSPSLPVLIKTIPGITIPVSLPSNFPTYSPTKYASPGQPLGFSPPKIPHVSLPKPSPAACKNCCFPSLQSMRPEPCHSCPFFMLVLNSDLILPADQPTFGSVRFQGFCSDQGRGFQLFAKVYTENGILKMPQSLNLVPSDNPHPIPKQLINGEVTVTFLNTALLPTPLKGGQTVGMGQIIYIKT